jgi:hypothetical protein
LIDGILGAKNGGVVEEVKTAKRLRPRIWDVPGGFEGILVRGEMRAGGRKATTVKGFGGSARRSIPAAATQHDRFGLSFACHAMPFREKRGEERRGVKEEIVGRVLCRVLFGLAG